MTIIWFVCSYYYFDPCLNTIIPTSSSLFLCFVCIVVVLSFVVSLWLHIIDTRSEFLFVYLTYARSITLIFVFIIYISIIVAVIFHHSCFLTIASWSLLQQALPSLPYDCCLHGHWSFPCFLIVCCFCSCHCWFVSHCTSFVVWLIHFIYLFVIPLLSLSVASLLLHFFH